MNQNLLKLLPLTLMLSAPLRAESLKTLSFDRNGYGLTGNGNPSLMYHDCNQSEFAVSYRESKTSYHQWRLKAANRASCLSLATAFEHLERGLNCQVNVEIDLETLGIRSWDVSRCQEYSTGDTLHTLYFDQNGYGLTRHGNPNLMYHDCSQLNLQVSYKENNGKYHQWALKSSSKVDCNQLVKEFELLERGVNCKMQVTVDLLKLAIDSWRSDRCTP